MHKSKIVHGRVLAGHLASEARSTEIGVYNPQRLRDVFYIQYIGASNAFEHPTVVMFFRQLVVPLWTWYTPPLSTFQTYRTRTAATKLVFPDFQHISLNRPCNDVAP